MTPIRPALLLAAALTVLGQGAPPGQPPVPESHPNPAPAAPAPAPAAPPAAATPAPVQQMPADEAVAILGQPVQGPDKGEVGRLVDVLVDGAGRPRAAVLDFGGFLGLGNRRVAVDWKALHVAPADKDHPLSLDLTTDQIKAAPEYKDTRASNAVVAPPPAAAPPAPAPASAPASAPSEPGAGAVPAKP